MKLKVFFMVPVLLFLTFSVLSCSCEKDEAIPEPIEPETGTEINLFIAIHNEPGPNPESTIYQEQRWLALVDLVETADNYGHKLNLLFNPQWATYILADQDRLNLVRSWETNGHEIGLHNHGHSLGNWNGYTDQEEYFSDIKFIGTMDEMMNLMIQLPASGDIRVAAVSKDDADYDYPAGIEYDVDGGWDPDENLISSPSIVTYNGHTMTHLDHARYSGPIQKNVNVGLNGIEEAITDLEDNEAIGIVFHTFEFYEDSEPFTKLFEFLENNGISAKTVPDILEN